MLTFFRFHWNELCNETGAIDPKIESSGFMDLNEFKDVPFIIGTQNIPKFGKIQDTSTVKIRLLCLRIESVSSDILVSLSTPIDLEIFTDELFVQICKSFCIVDWKLFK